MENSPKGSLLDYNSSSPKESNRALWWASLGCSSISNLVALLFWLQTYVDAYHFEYRFLIPDVKDALGDGGVLGLFVFDAAAVLIAFRRSIRRDRRGRLPLMLGCVASIGTMSIFGYYLISFLPRLYPA
jgi:hypothetical protein